MKNLLSKLTMAAFVLTIGGGAVSCKKDNDPKPVPVAVKTITLDQVALELSVGQTATLKATVDPATVTATWSTSDAGVATVKAGVVTALKEGTAEIKAKAGDKEAVCKVTVKKGSEVNTERIVEDFYFPTGSTTAEWVAQKAEIINAYTSLKWDLRPADPKKNPKENLFFDASKGSENHVFGMLAVIHTPSQGEPFMVAVGGYDLGTFEKNGQKIMELYGFTTELAKVTFEGDIPGVIGYNSKFQMQGQIYMQKDKDSNGAEFELIKLEMYWAKDPIVPKSDTMLSVAPVSKGIALPAEFRTKRSLRF